MTKRQGATSENGSYLKKDKLKLKEKQEKRIL
jgi:hypothetical protein